RSSLHLLLGRTLPPRLLQLTVEQLPPQRHRGLEFLLSDPLPDLLTRPRRLHERQPVPRRALTLVRDDLDRVPVLQLPRQRRDPAVHLRTRTVQSDLRVHREREVDRRRPLRQLLHVPPRREDEDLVLEQVDPKELHELLGRSEDHTSQLQSREKLVCRLLLEKKEMDTLSIDHAIPSAQLLILL